MKLSALIETLPFELAVDVSPGGSDPEIERVVEDSRRAAPGALFVARCGGAHDGARFIEDAVGRGAVAVLTDRTAPAVRGAIHARCDDPARSLGAVAEQCAGAPSEKLDLIGVTGTNGKTTVATLVQGLLKRLGVRCGLIGTVVIDDGAESRPAELTTPAAPELSAALARMVSHGCRAAVMEASSHALAQGRVDAMRFRGAVFTNLSGDHLDYHGTMEDYVAAKQRLFEMLPPDGIAVLNSHDPAADAMARAAGARGARVIRCAIDDDRAEARVRIVRCDVNGAVLSLIGPWGAVECAIPLVGRHNAMNAIQATVVAHHLGANADAIAGALPRLTAPPGRLERVPARSGQPAVFVDYAHTDDALVNVLDAVRPLVPAGGDLWVVFGCGGDRDRSKRARMAEAASRGADRIVVTSDNPRTEDPGAIVEEVLAGIPVEALSRVDVDVDRRVAIEHAIRAARETDVVVIAGKGHEDYQIVGTERRAFDDREVARSVLIR